MSPRKWRIIAGFLELLIGLAAVAFCIHWLHCALGPGVPEDDIGFSPDVCRDIGVFFLVFGLWALMSALLIFRRFSFARLLPIVPNVGYGAVLAISNSVGSTEFALGVLLFGIAVFMLLPPLEAALDRGPRFNFI